MGSDVAFGGVDGGLEGVAGEDVAVDGDDLLAGGERALSAGPFQRTSVMVPSALTRRPREYQTLRPRGAAAAGRGHGALGWRWACRCRRACSRPARCRRGRRAG